MPDSGIIKLKSFFLVSVQFACIIILVFGKDPDRYSILSLITGIISIVIGIWAVMVMATGKLSIFPEVRRGAVFIRRGPYRIIRHPMYLAVILFCLAEVLAFFSFFRLGILLFLIVDLVVKMGHEENLLRKNFPEYPQYQEITKRLIPFIY